jgi:DNA-directed RNA polymerase subunit RPC12/RpoP
VKIIWKCVTVLFCTQCSVRAVNRDEENIGRKMLATLGYVCAKCKKKKEIQE